ncbi:MAG TPA: N-acetyltransferase [Pseudonocardiaceae bacterium]|jgi:L-amino acid N-acyltransferase YncA|nr:N-acetyltransferase [Pseudonocardiaceae bacterium]
MLIRTAIGDDWSAIWPFLQLDIAAGETFCFDRDATEERAREKWFPQPPGHTVVATGDQGAVVGIAVVRPNHSGPAAHVANASFWVNPEHSGRGIGRALGTHVLAQARADGYRAMQFNAVVETNTRAVALWRSLGFEVLTTVPEAFHHPVDGYVGLHIMYRRL